MLSSVSSPTCLSHLSKSSHHPTCSGILTQLMCHPSGFWLQSLNPTQPENVSGKQSLKMCLYTGSPDRLTSSYNNPQKNSLDQIVWEVMDRVNGEKISLEQDPGHRQGPGEESVPPVQNTNLPTSSLPWVFCPKEETQLDMCHIHALARAGPQYHIDSIQVRRQRSTGH